MADLTQDPSSTAAPAGASEGYRPLSLLALIGFLLALLFVATVLIGGLAAFATRYPRGLVVAIVATVVAGWLTALSLKRGVVGTIGMGMAGLVTLLGLGGLVAFSGTSPWLMPWPVWLLVGVALLTCWLARSQIAASEGTLGGSALTTWGIGLTLFFALNYGAYVLSSIYAVRSQGRECTDEFVALLTKGDVLEAFVRTMPPRSRPSGGDLRRAVEVEGNTASGPGGGAYTSFNNHALVRLLQLFGTDATYEKIAINEVYERNGCQVRVTYRGTTPMGIADFDVLAFGQESSDGAAVRRQWHIEMGAANLGEILKNFGKTDEGVAMFMAVPSTKPLAAQWLHFLETKQIGEAYLATVPPKNRQGQAEAHLLDQVALFTGLPLGGGLQSFVPSRQPYRDGLAAFRKGVILDVESLYPPKGSTKEAVRQEILAIVLNLLAGKARDDTRAEFAMADMPLYRRTDDGILITYPVKILSREGATSRTIEGDLEIVGPWTKELLPPSQYRVSRLRLYRGPEAMDPMRQKGMGR